MHTRRIRTVPLLTLHKGPWSQNSEASMRKHFTSCSPHKEVTLISSSVHLVSPTVLVCRTGLCFCLWGGSHGNKMRQGPRACQSKLPIKTLGWNVKAPWFGWVGLFHVSLFVMRNLRQHTKLLSSNPIPLHHSYTLLQCYYAEEQKFSSTTLGMHQVLGVHVFVQSQIRVWGTVRRVCFLISHLPPCTPKPLPSKHMQEGGMEPGTHEGKVNGRKGMLYPLIHIAGSLKLGGMFARTWALLYI